jgi:hypothetical protein
VENATEREASVCGEMERTGVREAEWADWEIKSRTSLCDWRVIRRDSVEVMQPLSNVVRDSKKCREKPGLTCRRGSRSD